MMAQELACTQQQLNPTSSISREVDVCMTIIDAYSPPAGLWIFIHKVPYSTACLYISACFMPFMMQTDNTMALSSGSIILQLDSYKRHLHSHHREKHCCLQAVLMRKWEKVHGQLWSITILSDFLKRFHSAKCSSNIEIYRHFIDLRRCPRIIILLHICCKINWGCPTGDSANSPTSGDVSDTWIPYQCGRRKEL